MKRLLVVMLFALSCSRTGLDDDDAGVDGGIDAGVSVDAGVPQCVTVNDCPPTTVSPSCYAGRVAQHSCVGGRCLFDCESARTCTADAGCMSCAGEACTVCQPFDAPPNAGRISRSCGETPVLLGGFTFTSLSSQFCTSLLTSDAGITARLDGRGAGVAEVNGSACTIHVLATALNRVELGCEDCTYLLEWP